MNKKEREAILEQIPWVTRIAPKPRAGLPMCDGIKWGTVALRDIYTMGGKPARGIKESSHCSFRARWRFRALRDSRARTGNYCLHHLFGNCLYLDDREQTRVEKFLETLGVRY